MPTDPSSKSPWTPPRRYDLQATSTAGGVVTALFETFVVTVLPLICTDVGTPLGTGCFVDTISCPTATPCAAAPTATGS